MIPALHVCNALGVCELIQSSARVHDVITYLHLRVSKLIAERLADIKIQVYMYMYAR